MPSQQFYLSTRIQSVSYVKIKMNFVYSSAFSNSLNRKNKQKYIKVYKVKLRIEY